MVASFLYVFVAKLYQGAILFTMQIKEICKIRKFYLQKNISVL